MKTPALFRYIRPRYRVVYMPLFVLNFRFRDSTFHMFRTAKISADCDPGACVFDQWSGEMIYQSKRAQLRIEREL